MDASSMLQILVIVAALAPAASQAERNPFIAAVDERRAHLRAAVETDPFESDSKPQLLGLLSKPLPNDFSEKDRRRLLADIVDIGVRLASGRPQTGYIEDDEVIPILVAALWDPSPDMRNAACIWLMQYGKPPQLAPYKETIKEAVKRYNISGRFELVSMLPLDASEKAELLKRQDLSVEVRARLGDTNAEAQIVNRFLQAKTFDEKEQAAGALGAVGTTLCGQTLVKALNTPLTEKTNPGIRSLRIAIIKALGSIHPDEPLLTSELRQIIGAGGDERAGGPERIRAYLHEVADWGFATYGVRPEGPEPAPLLAPWYPARTLGPQRI